MHLKKHCKIDIVIALLFSCEGVFGLTIKSTQHYLALRWSFVIFPSKTNLVFLSQFCELHFIKNENRISHLLFRFSVLRLSLKATEAVGFTTPPKRRHGKVSHVFPYRGLGLRECKDQSLMQRTAYPLDRYPLFIPALKLLKLSTRELVVLTVLLQ